MSYKRLCYAKESMQNVPQYPKCLRHGTTYVYSRKHKLCSLTHNCREVGHTTFFSWRITSYFTTQSMSSDTTNTLHNTNTTCIVAWHTTYVPQHKNICLKAQNMFPKAHSSKYHPGCCEKASMQGWSLPFFPILSYSFLSLLPFFPFFLPSFLPSFLSPLSCIPALWCFSFRALLLPVLFSLVLRSVLVWILI